MFIAYICPQSLSCVKHLRPFTYVFVFIINSIRPFASENTIRTQPVPTDDDSAGNTGVTVTDEGKAETESK